jgi:IS5 family transposase
MRKRLNRQLPLFPTFFDHPHASELASMSATLDAVPEAIDRVAGDLLAGGVDPENGRTGMTPDQVLRALMVKQMRGFSYEQLAFHLADSRCYRAFCRIGDLEEAPRRSTLQENIKKVTAPTLERINQLLVRHAKEEGVEDGRKVRVDSTVVESNIHDPSDSSLLFDVVTTLTRLLRDATAVFPIGLTDHTRRAKRRARKILSAKRMKARLPLYDDLLKVTKKTIGYAKRAVQRLLSVASKRSLALVRAFDHFIQLGEKVMDQTRRRVFEGEKVPAQDKVVSIFEPHADIIIKSFQEVYFGHKVCLAAGRSSMVLDCVIEDGNPADVTLAERMIRRQEQLYGRSPRQAAFDGAFFSKANLDALKDMGVKDVAFSKYRDVSVEDMAKSTWVYKALWRFRAGVEGCISFLKRCFGLGRCTWRGLCSFKSYVWSSVVAYNLLTLARRKLQAG